LDILNKYLPNATTTIFPTYTNQHTNRLLKVIAGIAKTPMRLTFHIGRHTFGSMMAEIIQNPYLIMDLMGHADIKTSMIYIHTSQERINRQLKGLNWNLS
jgi:integrase